MEQKNWASSNFWYLIGAMFLGFILIRFVPVGRFFLLGLIFLLPVVGLVYFIKNRLEKSKDSKASMPEEKKALLLRKEQCDLSILSLKSELENIDNSIAELQGELVKPEAIPITTRQKTEQLLNSFLEEKELRLAKIRFYQSCKEKLEMLDRNHTLTLALKEKVNQLKQLKESHYEDLAEMESLRSDLSFQQGFFESLDQLSLRVLNTESIGDTEVLHKELEKMVDEI
jgi:hypothetical protein